MELALSSVDKCINSLIIVPILHTKCMVAMLTAARFPKLRTLREWQKSLSLAELSPAVRAFLSPVSLSLSKENGRH